MQVKQLLGIKKTKVLELSDFKFLNNLSPESETGFPIEFRKYTWENVWHVYENLETIEREVSEIHVRIKELVLMGRHQLPNDIKQYCEEHFTEYT